MKHDYEYIVLGLGGIGSAAAYWLARRAGGDVLGLEQFAIGHVRGASQDHSRIIRLSYHSPVYVELAKHSYRAWAALEHDADESLILRTGGLDFGPRESALPLSDYSESLSASGVPFESLDAAEIMHRWPQFQLTDDIHGIYQAEGGIAPAARCNAAHIRMARAHGAALREHAPVRSLRPVGDEIEVATDDATYRCRKLVVAADAWTNQVLANFGLKLPLTVTQEQVSYFASPQPADFAPERFPVWIWMDEPSFYGLPVYGEAGPKAGQDVGGREVSAETRTFDRDPAAHQRLEGFLRRYIPGALGPVIYTKTCLYTLTPDRDFVIDSLPEQPNVLVALGAAHAFKFASLFGKILSELAIDGATACDISTFNIDRPILREERPAQSFMI
jgi:sarcosine oxidase